MSTKLIYALISLFAIHSLSSCVRRPLYDPAGEEAMINLSVDWSASGIADPSTINAFSVYFFPDDGSEPYVRVSNDLSGTTVMLPRGVYSVLLFNETTNPADWSGLSFRSTGSYSTFEAFVVTNPFEPDFLFIDHSGHVAPSADVLAAWRLDRFEVTDSIVRVCGCGQYPSASITPDQLVNIRPTPLVTRVEVDVTVLNLNNALKAGGILNNMAQSVVLYNGKQSSRAVSHYFDFNKVTWDDDARLHGTVNSVFYVFDHIPFNDLDGSRASDVTYTLMFDAHNYYGAYVPPAVYDITDHVTTAPDGYIYISAGPYELPGYSGSDVNIGDWDDEIIQVQ